MKLCAPTCGAVHTDLADGNGNLRLGSIGSEHRYADLRKDVIYEARWGRGDY